MSLWDKYVSSEDTLSFDSESTVDAYESDEGWEWKPKERMAASLQESWGAIWGGLGAAADALGADKASDWMVNRSEEMFEKAAEHDIVRTSFDDGDLQSAEGIENYLKWGAELVTGYIPDAAMMIFGGLGAGTAATKLSITTAGKVAVNQGLRKGIKKNYDKIYKEAAGTLTRKEALDQATKTTAREFGALVGASGVEGWMGGGQAYLLDKEQRGEDANPWAALGTGAAQSAMGMLSPLNKVFAGRLPKGKAGLAQMTIGEASEEVGQEIIAMAHEAGISEHVTLGALLASPEGHQRLLESGIAGALLGSAFGGPGMYLRRDRKPTEETEPDPIETPEDILKKHGIETDGDAKTLIRDIPRPSEGMLTQATMSPESRETEQKLGAFNRGEHMPQPKPKELKDLVIKSEAIVEETGETVEIDMPADVAIKEADTKIEQWYKVRGCLGL